MAGRAVRLFRPRPGAARCVVHSVAAAPDVAVHDPTGRLAVTRDVGFDRTVDAGRVTGDNAASVRPPQAAGAVTAAELWALARGRVDIGHPGAGPAARHPRAEPPSPRTPARRQAAVLRARILVTMADAQVELGQTAGGERVAGRGGAANPAALPAVQASRGVLMARTGAARGGAGPVRRRGERTVGGRPNRATTWSGRCSGAACCT